MDSISCVRGLRSLIRRTKSKKKITLPVDAGRSPNLFPSHPPPTPQEILDSLDQLRSHSKEIRYKRFPDDVDNSLKSLYRLYEFVMLDDNICIRNEIEYFWNRHTWTLAEIPYPEDTEPAREAVLAGCVGLLEIAFNNKIKIGGIRDGRSIRTWEEFQELKARERIYESAPAWVTKVKPLDETIRIPTCDGELLESFDDERASEPFKAKNILIWQPHILFV